VLPVHVHLPAQRNHFGVHMLRKSASSREDGLILLGAIGYVIGLAAIFIFVVASWLG